MNRLNSVNLFLKFYVFLFFMIFFSFKQTSAFAFRLHSITPLVSFNMGLQLKQDQQIKSVTGPGAGATICFALTQHWRVSLTGGYFRLKVNQSDPIPYWNWQFWNRFYGNYIRDLQRDSNYVAQLSYRQALNLIPAIVTVGFQHSLLKRVTLTWQFGGGLYLFKRTLAVHEKWSKYFPEKDYVFTYAFDNHANPHSGNIPVGLLGVEANFQLSKHLKLHSGLNLQQFFNAGNKTYFPFKRLFQFKIGLQFLH